MPRSSATGSVTLFGGMAPVTLTWLIRQTGSNVMPAFYLIGVTVFSVLVVAATKRDSGRAEQLISAEAVS